MAADMLCALPNHNLPFDIYTDTLDYQLGSCIMQDGKPVACYVKKPNSTQKNYSTIDKELLSIGMTLKEFRSMLLGAVIIIHTDHKDILHLGGSYQRCLRWIMYMDEYGHTLHYIKGLSDVIADMFSYMPMQDTMLLAMVGKDEPKIDPFDCHFSFTDDRKMTECFVHLLEEECHLNLSPDSKSITHWTWM